MKKLLIPILTTAAIAPVATSMVACSNTAISLDTILKVNDMQILKASKPVNIVENKIYKLVVDTSKLPTKGMTYAGFIVVAGDDGRDFSATAVKIDILNTSVKVGSKTLEKTSGDKIDADHYAVADGEIGVSIDSLSLKKKITITVSYESSEDNQNFYGVWI